MDALEEDRLRCQQLVAMGRIMAGFTHELKNHLAIINESNGLLADLLEMEMVTDENLATRIGKIVKTTKERVGQAAEMAKHLNGFAHRMDTPLANFKINEMITEELCFLHRFARLKQVDLETHFATDLPLVYNNPSIFHFIIFCLFDQALTGLAANDHLLIRTALVGDKVEITLCMRGQETTPTCLDPVGIVSDAVYLAVAKVGGSLEKINTAKCQFDFVLTISSLKQ